MKYTALSNMIARLKYRGGSAQQDRMIADKRKTLDRAVLYSYQGAKIKLIDSNDTIPALINPNRLLADYDEKILSVGYEYNIKPGSIFEWVNTGTKWIVYLQDLTELAYFKGDVRKCNYEIKWEDEEGIVHSVPVSVTGPSEKKIKNITKPNFNMDLPSYTLSMLLPKTAETVKRFNRYSKFYLQGLEDNDTPICWRVEAIDSISLPGILEVYAREYYANDDVDDIENGIVGGLIQEPEIEGSEFIVGDTFIKPKFEYEFTYNGTDIGEWSYDKKCPITSVIDGKTIKITWTKSYSGQFELSYNGHSRTIVVESLF